jgi:exodeoxyribonuclease-5
LNNKILKSSFVDYFQEKLGFEPTFDQSKAIENLTDFMWNFGEQASEGLELFILTGYAGTGKTSLISGFVNSLPLVKLKAVLLAPTGRAAKVLSNYSHLKASTIHRKIYFKNEMEGTEGFILGENKHKNTLFIVDEASMIATKSSGQNADVYQRNLLDDLVEYVYSGDNCRLIFVGDKGQLPPIGMDKSPALEKDYLEATYSLKIFSSELSEIVRQAKMSGVLEIAHRLRDFDPIPPFLPWNNTDTFAICGVELQEKLEEAITTYGRDEVMVVTRSNKRANLFNEQIRRRILWQEEDLNAGDVIMATRNNYHWLDPKSEAGFIANGELMEILKIIRREEVFGGEFADVVVRLIDYPEMKDVEVKILLNSIRHEGPSLPREDMKQLFYRIAAEEYSYLRNKKEILRMVMQNPYFQAIQVKFGYAVTCHKAQGGQWAAVFVDHGYFLEEMWDIEYMRWLYTAITRARNELFLVNFAPNFVGELDAS